MAGRAPDEGYWRDVRFPLFGPTHASLTSRLSAGKLGSVTTTTTPPHFSVSAPLTISIHHIPTSYFLNNVTCPQRSILGGLLLFQNNAYPVYYGLMSEYDGWMDGSLRLWYLKSTT